MDILIIEAQPNKWEAFVDNIPVDAYNFFNSQAEAESAVLYYITKNLADIKIITK